MPNGTGVSEAAKIALSSANTLFLQGELDLHVQTLNKTDLEWCIALQRFQPDDRRLPWDQCGRTLYDPCLDGNTFRFTLYVVALFMAITECHGLRLIAPVNNRVATYYMRQYGFIDLTEGAREILYHDAAGLYSVLSDTSSRIEGDY